MGIESDQRELLESFEREVVSMLGTTEQAGEAQTETTATNIDDRTAEKLVRRILELSRGNSALILALITTAIRHVQSPDTEGQWRRRLHSAIQLAHTAMSILAAPPIEESTVNGLVNVDAPTRTASSTLLNSQ